MQQMLAVYIYIINYATMQIEFLWWCSHFLHRGNFCKSNTFKSTVSLPILYIGLTEITGLCSMPRAICDQTIFKAGRPGFWNRLAQFKMGWRSVSKWVSSWESGLSKYNITVLLLSDICIGYCLWSVWYVCKQDMVLLLHAGFLCGSCPAGMAASLDLQSCSDQCAVGTTVFIVMCEWRFCREWMHARCRKAVGLFVQS